jgi:uncharacterized protein YdiU (UPF0061 family)
MKGHNPSVIPRNQLVEKALTDAQNGDLALTQQLLAALAKPFEAPPEFEEFRKTPSPDPNFKTFCGT